MLKHIHYAIAGLLLHGLAAAGSPVDVNQASAEELAAGLDGVGPAKAEAIIAYREANGPFEDPDELVNVKGIGIKTVDLNREFILISGAELASTDEP